MMHICLLKSLRGPYLWSYLWPLNHDGADGFRYLMIINNFFCCKYLRKVIITESALVMYFKIILSSCSISKVMDFYVSAITPTLCHADDQDQNFVNFGQKLPTELHLLPILSCNASVI